jgi:hypothetical protein
MKGIFGAVATGGSGKFGNAVFLRNGVIRAKVIPTNPNTTRQGTVRNFMRFAGPAWSELTPAQRTAWGDYGKTLTRTDEVGRQYTLTGFNAFCATFMLAALGNEATAVGDAPSTPGPADAPLIADAKVHIDTDDMSVEFTGEDLYPKTDGYHLFARISGPQSVTRNSKQRPDRVVHVFEGNTAIPRVSPFLFKNPWGVMAAGVEQDVEFYVLAPDGRVSTTTTRLLEPVEVV